MAQTRDNKRKQIPNSRKKEITPNPHQNPWPNLPQQIRNLIASQTSLMKNITSFGCVIKTWRSPSNGKHCSPNGKLQWSQLIEINPKNSSHYHVIDIPYDEKYYFYHRHYKNYKGRSYLQVYYQGKSLKGHSYGYAIAMWNSTGCYLMDPVRRRNEHLPKWDIKIPFKMATLSSQPKEYIFPSRRARLQPRDENRIPCIAMVITGISRPAFSFYRQGKEENDEWIYEDSILKDPYCPGQDMEFTNAIGFQGKFFVLSLQGSLVVMEDVDSCFRVTGIAKNRVVPSKVSRQFREFLVECDGEILLVFLISRKSIDVVDDVEVLRLDVPNLVWVKVESLKGRALFLEDECCMWVHASRVGCRSDCIYFTHHRINEWFLYEMETGKIFGDCMRWDDPNVSE